jgi:hypothetical protein
MDIEFEITGDTATAFEEIERINLHIKMVNDLAEAVKKEILKEFDLSMRLMAYTGQHGGSDVVKAIIRSIKVDVLSLNPPVIEAKFTDDLSHWYDGGELPSELAEIVQGVFDDGINKWFNSPEASHLITKSLGL